MVQEKTRNFIVGLTFITAMVLVGYGVLMLGKTPSLLTGQRPYTVRVLAENANSVTGGAKVDLNGVLIGQVQSVGLVEAEGKFQAEIMLAIDPRFDIPDDSTASISKSVTGTTSLSITASSLKGKKLDHTRIGTIKAATSDASGLIPKDIRDNLAAVSQQLSTVARDMHILMAYHTPEEVLNAASQPATQSGERPVDNIATLVIRLNRTMKNVEELLEKGDLQSDIREIVKNVKTASVTLNTTLNNINTTVKNADKAFSSMGSITASATKTFDSTQTEIMKISEKLVDMLGQIEKATRQISEGNGTTAKLINDPRLYEGLVDLSKTLSSTAKDLDFLIKKWKDEGVNFKLK